MKDDEYPSPTQEHAAKHFVKLKDTSGNEWLFTLDTLKKAKNATQAELGDWVEMDIVTLLPGILRLSAKRREPQPWLLKAKPVPAPGPFLPIWLARSL